MSTSLLLTQKKTISSTIKKLRNVGTAFMKICYIMIGFFGITN